MACYAVLRHYLDYDGDRLRGLAVRFTSPVYPGDVIRFDFWRESDARSLRLRARCEARDVTVLDYGLAEID
jgi:acyl dehydratase